MNPQTTTYKIASVIQTISVIVGLTLMVATFILAKLDIYEPSALTGLLVGLCFFLVAASSAVKTFSQEEH